LEIRHTLHGLRHTSAEILRYKSWASLLREKQYYPQESQVVAISPRRQIVIQKTNSNAEFYLKGVNLVEVLSEVKNDLMEIRAKTTFLHTSAYSDGKRQVRVGVTQKR
jgi:hypothetical protein